MLAADTFDTRRQRIGEQAEIGSEGDGAVPFAHPVGRAADVADHDASGQVVPVGNVGYAFDGILERGRVELARNPHLDRQIVVPDPQAVDAVDGRDVL
jgi:hypothetical protein